MFFTRAFNMFNNTYYMIGQQLLEENKEKRQEQRKIAKESIDNQIAQLPSGHRYLLIYPCSDHDYDPIKEQLKAKNMVPYLLVYTNINMTLFELMQQFINQIDLKSSISSQQKIDPQKLILSLKVQDKESLPIELQKSKKIIDYQKQMRLESLDGLKLQVQFDFSDYKNQSAMTIVTSCLNINDIQVAFYVPDMEYYFYLPVNVKNFSGIRKQISEQLLKLNPLNVKIDTDNIKLYIKDQNIFINQQNYKRLTRNDTVIVKFKQPVYFSKSKRNTNKAIKFIDPLGKEVVVDFQKVKNIKVQTIFLNYLNFCQLNLNPGEYCLRIIDQLIKPSQKISQNRSIQKLMNKCEVNYIFLTAHVIFQRYLFYKDMQIIVKQPLDLQNILCSLKVPQCKRTQINQIIRQRAINYNKSYIKDMKQIYYYTTHFEIIWEDKTKSRIYIRINTFLRSLIFGNYVRKTQNSFNLKYTYQMIQNCKSKKQIKPVSQSISLWRGSNMPNRHKQGEIITYKQFLSTSISKGIALGFCKTILFQIKKHSNAYEIQDYSDFPYQEEVLFMPYSRFQVTKILYNQEHPQLKGTVIDIIQLMYLPFPKLVNSTATFILWMCNEINKESGEKTLKNIIKNQNTFLKELYTLQSLNQWLNTNKAILEDQTIKLVMVTNMTRVDNQGNVNQQGGIQNIKLFRKFKPQGNILVYIGKLSETKRKLQKSGLQQNQKLIITNKEKQMLLFLQKHCKIVNK